MSRADTFCVSFLYVAWTAALPVVAAGRLRPVRAVGPPRWVKGHGTHRSQGDFS